MEKFRFFDHTADVLFEAYGGTINEMFRNAALALQESQFNLATIESNVKKTFSLKDKKIEMLLFDFLQELIFLKDAKQMAIKDVKVLVTVGIEEKVKKGMGEKKLEGGAKKEDEVNKNGFSLKAICIGDKLDLKKQESKVDAKAITLHEFAVKKENNIWKARVIVDI